MEEKESITLLILMTLKDPIFQLKMIRKEVNIHMVSSKINQIQLFLMDHLQKWNMANLSLDQQCQNYLSLQKKETGLREPTKNSTKLMVMVSHNHQKAMDGKFQLMI